MDNPTQNLESYFLNIVNEAKESEEETSGATSGSQVAEYLRGDKNGLWKQFYNNRALHSEKIYNNGIPEGEWLFYNKYGEDFMRKVNTMQFKKGDTYTFRRGGNVRRGGIL